MRSSGRTGTLIVAHGSEQPAWHTLVKSSVPLSAIPGPAVLAFLEEVPEQDIPWAVSELEAQGVTDIIAIPLFFSSASIDVDEVRYALGLSSAPPKAVLHSVPVATRCRIRLTPAFDRSPIIGGILAERAMALSADPGREAVILVGHGQERAEKRLAWEENLTALGRHVRERGGFAAVDFALLNPDNVRPKVTAYLEKGPVIVVPAMLAPGYFTDQVRRRVQDLPCRYSGEAVLPHPDVIRWVLSERAAALGESA